MQTSLNSTYDPLFIVEKARASFGALIVLKFSKNRSRKIESSETKTFGMAPIITLVQTKTGLSHGNYFFSR